MTDYLNMFDDNFFPIGFAKPQRIVFNTNKLQDMNPAHWKKTDTGYVGIFKTLGCDNISLTVEDYGIKLLANGDVFGNKYDTTLELPINKEILSNIIEIKYETKAGITKVEIILEKPEKKRIKINGEYIKDYVVDNNKLLNNTTGKNATTVA